MASLGILKQLTSLTAEATAREMPPYETKRESVQRLKTKERFPSASINWGDCSPPDHFEDYVFDAPPSIPQEE